MTTEIRYEFSGPAPEPLLAEIRAGFPGRFARHWLVWRRYAVFFAAFIVVPGVLGYLKLASEKFIVGLIVGGYAAMIIDGFMMQLRGQAAVEKEPKFIDSSHTVLSEKGVAVTVAGKNTLHKWRGVLRAEKLETGMVLTLYRSARLALDTASLPEGTEVSEVLEQIEAWRSSAQKRKSARAGTPR